MDLIILQLCRERTVYNTVVPELKGATLDDKTMFLLREYQQFYRAFPDVAEITPDAWKTFFETFRHRDLSAEEKATYRTMMNKAFEPVDEAVSSGILRKVHELNLATRMANLASEYDSGKEIDLQMELQIEFDKFKLSVKGTDEDGNWIRDDINDLLAEEERDDGIKWRLQCVNHCMRPMRPGDWGLIAGRPDRGKSTFICSESTYWAPQCPPERPIIWLNNEGPGRRIIPRLYQAALNLTMPELIDANKKGTLVGDYITAIGGDISNIRVIDIHGHNVGQVLSIIERHDPHIVIYDMIDHIKGGNGSGDADHKRLEELYKLAREWCVLYNHIGIATSQISVDGDGMLYPLQHMLKDSKTGKQGALDFQLMMGNSNDPMLEHVRGIGLEKNKLQRAGNPKSPRTEVQFDGARARLIDTE